LLSSVVGTNLYGLKSRSPSAAVAPTAHDTGNKSTPSPERSQSLPSRSIVLGTVVPWDHSEVSEKINWTLDMTNHHLRYRYEDEKQIYLKKDYKLLEVAWRSLAAEGCVDRLVVPLNETSNRIKKNQKFLAAPQVLLKVDV